MQLLQTLPPLPALRLSLAVLLRWRFAQVVLVVSLAQPRTAAAAAQATRATGVVLRQVARVVRRLAVTLVFRSKSDRFAAARLVAQARALAQAAAVFRVHSQRQRRQLLARTLAAALVAARRGVSVATVATAQAQLLALRRRQLHMALVVVVAPSTLRAATVQTA